MRINTELIKIIDVCWTNKEKTNKKYGLRDESFITGIQCMFFGGTFIVYNQLYNVRECGGWARMASDWLEGAS